MDRLLGILAAALLFVGITGCETADISRRDIGTATGAAVGGVVGHELTDGPLGTAGGAAAGAIIGSEIGERMDQ
jgi:osmotically inducible lipoprotein OsmB